MNIEQTASNVVESHQISRAGSESNLASEQWTRENVDVRNSKNMDSIADQSRTVRLPELTLDHQPVYDLAAAHGHAYSRCVAEVKAALADPEQNVNHRQRSEQWISNRCEQVEKNYDSYASGSARTTHGSSHSDGSPVHRNPSPGQIYAYKHSGAGHAWTASAAGHAWDASAAGHAWKASHPGWNR